jgi:hypothetical protein
MKSGSVAGVPVGRASPDGSSYGYNLWGSGLWYEGNGTWNTLGSGWLADNQWHFYCISGGGSQMTSYRDGVALGSAGFAAATFPACTWFTLGEDNRLGSQWAGNYISGSMDEVRVENMPRSANWLWACYMTAVSNSVFNSYGNIITGSTVIATSHGIPYSWLTAHGITNTSDSVETACLNGTGLNILQDYIAGLDPMNANSRFSVTVTNLNGQVVVIVPSVQADATYCSGKTRCYDIEYCTNLMSGSWQPVSGEAGITGNGSVITYTNAASGGSMFYRARVRLQ